MYMICSMYHVSYQEYGLPQSITTDDKTKAYETAYLLARNLAKRQNKVIIFIHQHTRGKPPIRIATLSNE